MALGMSCKAATSLGWRAVCCDGVLKEETLLPASIHHTVSTMSRLHMEAGRKRYPRIQLYHLWEIVQEKQRSVLRCIGFREIVHGAVQSGPNGRVACPA
eukprot:4309120-Prymnesium_polylepis.1